MNIAIFILAAILYWQDFKLTFEKRERNNLLFSSTLFCLVSWKINFYLGLAWTIIIAVIFIYAAFIRKKVK